MPSVTYDYVPDQMVFVITDGTVRPGVVSLVDIEIDSTETVITYWILVDEELIATPFDQANVFASCRAAPGFQDVVYLTDLTGSPSLIAIDGGSPLLGGSPPFPTVGSPPIATLSADVLIDGTIPVTLTHTIVGGETFADLITEMNTQMGGAAVASLYQNNIRITSATTGTTSTVDILDGSPGEEYFRFLNGFTGLAAPIDGLDEGAIETLSNELCMR